jgi:hypothetical protein
MVFIFRDIHFIIFPCRLVIGQVPPFHQIVVIPLFIHTVGRETKKRNRRKKIIRLTIARSSGKHKYLQRHSICHLTLNGGPLEI